MNTHLRKLRGPAARLGVRIGWLVGLFGLMAWSGQLPRLVDLTRFLS